MSTSEEQSAAYEQALAALNEAQRRAVLQIEGPVLVVAGPGTGKTQILTLRIAQILQQTDAAPEHILALTFTESGAQAMRSRLRQYLGAAAYRVGIYTFHGFADMLIRAYPDAFPRIVGGSPVSDIEKITYLESILDSGSYSSLRPVGNPYYHVRSLMQQISTMKRENVTPRRLRDIIQDQISELDAMEQYHETGAHAGKVRGAYTKQAKRVEKNSELIAVYEAYEALLRAEHRYDFEDMILEAVAALQADETMLRELQETYQYVLADEHQDVNESQNTILEQLVSYHEQPNIFVVGDEKQAIYRFQGASLSNFLYFGDRFVGTTVIDLTDNYRSGQAVLDAAQSIIATDDENLQSLRVPLTAAAVPEAQVSVHGFSHEVGEEAWLVSAIQDRLAAGIPPEEIAVMVRTNQAVEHVAHLLRAADISVQASADSDINRHPLTQQIRALLDAVARPEREQAVATVLHAPYWGIALADLQRVLQARSMKTPLLALLNDQSVLEEIGVTNVPALLRVYTTIEKLHRASVTMLPHRVLETALHESGLLEFIHAHDAVEGGRVVRRLYDTVEQHVRSGEMRTVSDIGRILSQYEAYNVPLAAPYITTGTHAVHVMTAHKAKGLEFDTVFAPYVTDSVWGGKTRREQFAVPLTPTAGVGGEEDDDRRLLYVVMTRAKTTLHLSYAAENADGKARTMSRFLVSLESEDLATWPSTEAFTSGLNLVTTIPHTRDTNYETLFAVDRIRTLLSERGLSATSLNNYRSSPWNYFYRNVLRWPELPTMSLQYGTVVHACLERSVRTYIATKKLASATQLTEYLGEELQRLPLTDSEYTQLHEKGLAELVVYHEHVAMLVADTARIVVEQNVRVVLDTNIPDLPELPLTGKLDRIDYDASGRISRVVDYKTGKPKTRNEILGQTAKADDAYWYQLRFYALLLFLQDLHHDDIAYTLSFVQPTAAGKIKEEAFYITTEEIKETKELVLTVAAEIARGSFLSTPCVETESDYCDLLAMVRAVHPDANA